MTRACGAGEQTREVVGAVADGGQRLLGQGGEHKFAGAADGQHGVVERVDDLRAEVVLPDVGAVLGLVGLAGHTGAHDLGQPVDAARGDIEGLPDLVAHLLGPRLSTEHRVLEAGLTGIRAELAEPVRDREQVGGRGEDGLRLEIADQLALLLGLPAGHRDHRAPQPLGAVVRAQAAGEQAVTVGGVHLVPRLHAGAPEAPGHEGPPRLQVVLGVRHHGGLSRGGDLATLRDEGLARVPGTEEVDVHTLRDCDGGTVRRGVVARHGEAGIGQGEDHPAVDDAEPVEHLLAHGHGDDAVPGVGSFHRDPEPFGCTVPRQNRMMWHGRSSNYSNDRSVCNRRNVTRVNKNPCMTRAP